MFWQNFGHEGLMPPRARRKSFAASNKLDSKNPA
jgi:hypothetical protein